MERRGTVAVVEEVARSRQMIAEIHILLLTHALALALEDDELVDTIPIALRPFFNCVHQTHAAPISWVFFIWSSLYNVFSCK